MNPSEMIKTIITQCALRSEPDRSGFTHKSASSERSKGVVSLRGSIKRTTLEDRGAILYKESGDECAAIMIAN